MTSGKSAFQAYVVPLERNAVSFTPARQVVRLKEPGRSRQGFGLKDTSRVHV